MNKLSKITMALCAGLLASQSALALVSYDISAGTLPIADGQQVNLVADLNGDGLGDLTDATTFTPGADDVLLSSFAMNSLLDAGSLQVSLANLDVTGLTGATLNLVYYDMLFDSEADAPGEGVDYGVIGGYAANAFGALGDAWTVDAETGSYSLNFVSNTLAAAFELPATAADPGFDGTTAAPQLLAGDSNGDGQVDGNDLISVEENFGAVGDPGIPGDANGDGQVDGNDLISVEENFGDTSGGASVPEPATLALLGLGSLLIARRRA